MRCSRSPNGWPDGIEHRGRGAEHRVLDEGTGVGTLDRQRHVAALGALHDQGVVQVEQGEDRLEAVISIVFAGQHAKQEVHLRVGRELDGGHRADWARMSLKAMGLTASDTRPSRVTGSRVVR